MLAALPLLAIGALGSLASGLEVQRVHSRGVRRGLCEPAAETRAPLCTLDPWIRSADSGAQSVRRFKPYVAKTQLPPGPGFDPNTTALVFLHLSKSGGMTVRSMLGTVAARRGWGKLELVTGKTGWDRILRNCSTLANRAQNSICNQAFYSSTNGMGLCEFINKPYCMYVSVLRDPASRQLSSYNYFCTLGREGRKGWLPGWTACRWSRAQWATLMADFLPVQLGTSQAPLRQLSPLQAAEQCATCPYLSSAPKGLHRAAVLAAAQENLKSGAVLPLFLDDLALGLRKLAGRLELPELEEEASRMKPDNAHPHPEDPKDLLLLRRSQALSSDEELYRYAQTVEW